MLRNLVSMNESAGLRPHRSQGQTQLQGPGCFWIHAWRALARVPEPRVTGPAHVARPRLPRLILESSVDDKW